MDLLKTTCTQILSQLVRFCRLYIKKHFGVFFSVYSVHVLLLIESCSPCIVLCVFVNDRVIMMVADADAVLLVGV